MAKQLDISVERIHPSGAWRLSTIKDGRLVHRTYYQCSKPWAVRGFKAHLRDN